MSRVSKYKLVNPFTFKNSIESGDGDTTVVFSGGLGESFGAYASDGGGVASRSGSLFNNVFADGTSRHFKFDDTNSAQEIFTVNFNKKIDAPNVKIVTHTRLSETFSFRLNGDANLDSGVLQGNTSDGAGGNTVKSNEVIFNLSNHSNQLSKIVFTMEDAVGTRHEFHEIQIFTDEGGVPFEFNDSLLATKAWNSSRYDGKQLQGTTINAFSEGDTSYGKTPVITNYSRNIYLGSRVIGMGELTSTGDVDDSSLLNYPGFSYVTVQEYLTVHDDLTVTRHSVFGDIPDKPGKPGTGNKIKKGWYQSWYSDFPVNSNISLKFFDENLETSIDSQYEVFFNGGQLKKLLHIREFDTASRLDTDPQFVAQYQTGSHNLRALGGVRHGSVQGSEHRFFIQHEDAVTHNIGASFTIFNQESIINNFFEGSLIASPFTTFTGTVASSTK